VSDYICTLCLKGKFQPTFSIVDGKKKLISITCDNCGFLIAPIEKANK
jgi:hypothetical protein